MALYQDGSRVSKVTDPAFDAIHNPGNAAPHAGIYQCTVCKHEIGIAAGHTLPSQSHAQHPASSGPIKWRLQVYAQHNT